MGLGRDGTLHGTYGSRSCLFPLCRPVSRKACKTKKKKLKKLNEWLGNLCKDETLTQVFLTIYSAFLNQNYPKYISVVVSKILEGNEGNVLSEFVIFLKLGVLW